MRISDIVTEEDTRPNGNPVKGKCFYCDGLIGGKHDPECVIPQRPVKIRMTIDLIVDVPRSWSKEQIEFHRNGSSWCASNALSEIERHDSDGRCLCSISETKYIGEATINEAIAAGFSSLT